MKILLIHQYFLEDDDPGGSRWNEIAKVWQKQGHEIIVVAGMLHYFGKEKRTEYKKKYCIKKVQGNITVWRTHVSESYNSNFVGRLLGYVSFVFSSLFVGLFKIREKYDIIVVTSPPLFVGITACILSFVKRKPFVFEVRDLWPESAIDTGVLKNELIIKFAFLFEKFIYKKASLICVLTPAFEKKLLDEKNVKKDKIIFIPNAADFSLSNELLLNFDANQFRNEHGLSDYFVLTYIGAHGLANNLQQILDAAERLLDTNALFLLVGEGMEKERLRDEAMKRRINNVRFIDAVPKRKVFEYILASDMGLSVLKKTDTFKTIYSNKTFDYMSCKKPILMAIDGVSRELLEKAKAGSFIEPEDPVDFEKIVRQYLLNPEKCITEGESGYRYAKKYFDREILANNYMVELTKI